MTCQKAAEEAQWLDSDHCVMDNSLQHSYLYYLSPGALTPGREVSKLHQGLSQDALYHTPCDSLFAASFQPSRVCFVSQCRIEQKSCKMRKRPGFCCKAHSRRFVKLCASIVFVCSCQKRQGFSGAIAAFRSAKAMSCAARNADKMLRKHLLETADEFPAWCRLPSSKTTRSSNPSGKLWMKLRRS